MSRDISNMHDKQINIFSALRKVIALIASLHVVVAGTQLILANESTKYGMHDYR